MISNAPRLIELTATSGPVTAHDRYSLEDVPAGATTVRLVASVAVGGPTRLLAPLVRRSIRRADAGQLDAFERLLDR
ncbi:MAG: hypothetical protein HRT86_06950 [Ilumatobacteraceae bacterium]|nr:hypothetical protein [Ilumatobacteraceae bacterium]